MVKQLVVLATTVSAADVTLATFGPSDATYRTWRQQNDPVMGGASSGKFTVTDGVGTMEGTCAIIPRLKVPGFITTSTSAKDFADVSSCTGIELEVRSESAYTGYRFDFGNDRSSCGKFFARGYKAPFTAPVGEYGKVQIPFNEFSRCWDDGSGEILKSCADDPSQCPTQARLQDLQALSIWAEGVQGDVKIDVKSVGAYGCGALRTEEATDVPLTTWDGTAETQQTWTAMNDPVMGGKSKASFTVVDDTAVFDGAVAIVPALKAPGFCTMQSKRGTFPDISKADALQIVARQTSEYKGWRFTIGDGPRNPDSGAPFFVRGQYKANVDIPVSDEFQTITLPFSEFTYKWSDTTGEPTVKCVDDASVCPTEKYLKSPKQMTITAEGVEGSFHLEVKSITAVNMASLVV